MPQRYCMHGSHNLGRTDSLPSICASLTKAMVSCICTCDTPVWHFVFVTLLPTSWWRVIKNFSCWSQSKTSLPPTKETLSLHYTYICQSEQQTKQHSSSSLYKQLTTSTSRDKYLRWNDTSCHCLWWVQHILTKYFVFFVNIKTIAKKTLSPLFVTGLPPGFHQKKPACPKKARWSQVTVLRNIRIKPAQTNTTWTL